jgi:formate-dependent nitrite reductase membrane component NrfD
MLKLKHLYLTLAVVSFLGCYYFIGKDILNDGRDFTNFFNLAFANNVTGLLSLDLTFSGLAFLPFAVQETKKLKIKNWWLPILTIGLVGICVAIPLFLYLREKTIEFNNSNP